MSNPVVFKFVCTACEQKVEQGAAPEQLYLEYNHGGETRVAGHQACSKCFRELLPYIRRQEKFDAEQEKNKPPKQFNLEKVRGGVPDSILDRLMDRAEQQEQQPVLPQLREPPPKETFDRYPPENRQEVWISNGPGPLDEPSGEVQLPPPAEQATLAMILAEMINTQNRMIETQERTNQLLVEMKSAPTQQQARPQNNNWRKNQQNARYRNSNNRPGRPGS